MAARKRKGTKDNPWPEKTRERIKTSMLVNRLTNHALGKNKMTNTQVTAALGLLKKSLPDLTATELDATVERAEVSAEPMTDAEWDEKYADSLATTGGATESVN